MNFLTIENILSIHDAVLENDGGLLGVNFDRLESCLSRIDNYALYNSDVILDLYAYAALYAISIAVGHPFNDGNKRTAFGSLIVFLYINGYEFDAPDNEVDIAMIYVVEKKIKLDQLRKWIQENSIRLA